MHDSLLSVVAYSSLPVNFFELLALSEEILVALWLDWQK